MRKSVEFTGKNEEAAIAAALEELGLAREDISVEVLELAKPGFLGIGGTPAKVKVTYEGPDEPEAAPAVEDVAQAPEAEKTAYAPVQAAEEPAADVAAEKTEIVVTPVPAGDEKAARIAEFLTGLLEKMGVDAAPQIGVDAEGNYQVELVGQDLGAVIGRRGETLDAIQQLTGYAINRGETRRVRVRIDAEGYRAKREETLARTANRVADKVIRTRRNFTLEPMNAYERHVVHTALQGREDITTYSVGAEPNRRTVIAYEPGANRD